MTERKEESHCKLEEHQMVSGVCNWCLRKMGVGCVEEERKEWP